MTVLTVGFIALSLLIPVFFMVHRRNNVALCMFGVCVVHIIAVLVQNAMLQSVTADAHLYYYDIEGYTTRPIELGTSAVVYVTQWLKAGFNLSFADLMIIFGLIGALAILTLCKWVDENTHGHVRTVGLSLCFLPGLHFWTSSIGKDAPIALGIFLVIYSTQNFRTRIWLFAIGAFLCLIIRPHIFIILMTSWLSAYVIRNRIPALRIGAIVLVIVLIPIAQIIIQNFLGINIFNLYEVSTLFSDRQSYFEYTYDEGVIYIGNPASRFIYFMFNPLFYNANDILSVFASFENLIFISMITWVFFNFRHVDDRHKTYAIFLVFFTISMMLFLGLGGYNLGLALRQKVMIYPALIVLVLMCEGGRVFRHSGYSALRANALQCK